MDKPSKWLSPKELEKEYGLKESTMDKYRMKNLIPFYKIGSKYIRYLRTEIDEWIMSHKVGCKNG